VFASVLKVFGADLVSKLLLAIATIELIRHIPSGQYALLTSSIAAYAIGSQVCGTALNRVYLVGGNSLSIESRLTAFAMSQIALAFVISCALSLTIVRDVRIAALVGLLAGATAYSELVKTYFQSKMRFGKFSLLEMLRSSVFVVAIAAGLLYYGDGLTAWYVVSVQAGAAVVSATLVLPVGAIKIRQMSLRQSFSIVRDIASSKYSWLFVYFGLLAILAQVDVVVSSLLLPSVSVAAYGSALRYYNIGLMSLAAVNSVFLPVLMRDMSSDAMARTMRIFWKMALVVVIGCIACIFVAPYALPIVDGGRYPAAVPAFQVLAVSAALSFALSPFATICTARGQFRFLSGLAAASVVTAAVAASLLIPTMSLVGAATSTLAGNLMLNAGALIRWKFALIQK
jgi:O-antigen/teichoic acid export membrane protein